MRVSMAAVAAVAAALAVACDSSGSPEQTAQPVPAPVPAVAPEARATAPLDGVEQIAAGLDHTCALRKGRVYCWGQTLRGDQVSAIATAESRLANISSIDAAGRRTCALGAGGSLYCWGEELGEGSQGVPGQVYVHPPSGSIPADLAIRWGALKQIDFGARVTKVAVGMIHICAITEDHELYCWGSSSGGQLRRPTPMNAAELIAEEVSEVEVGQGWTCFVAKGKRTCLGKHPGMGDLTQQQYVQMPGWIIAACGLSAVGEVFCGGRSPIVYGGDPVPADSNGEQVQVAGLAQVASLSVGYSTACALRADQSVWCWGAGSHPHPIALPGPATQIEVGSGHACALLDKDGLVECWGPGGKAHPIPVDDRVQPPPGPSIPSVAVTEAVARHQTAARPSPTTLDGTVWSVCLFRKEDLEPPCGFCRHTLRFEPRGRFVSEATCKDPRYSDTRVGRWQRTGDQVRAREKRVASGAFAEWRLRIRGQSIEGERGGQPGVWDPSTVRGSLVP